MHFLAPAFLHLAWLALIPLALYLFRRQARRVSVSTLLFFRSLAKEHQESAALRRLKRILSLLLTLAIILAAALALARPASTASDATSSLVIVLDRSASMDARDAKGRSRLDEAKAVIKERVRALPEETVASLIAFDSKPTVLISRSRNRRDLIRLLEETKTQPREARTDAALSVAHRLAELERPSEVWLVSDSSDSSVALPSPVNAGITGFQLRKAPLARGRYEAFVKISAAAANPRPLTATLEARIAGRLAQLRELELKPGDSTSLILPIEGIHGQRIELELKAAGDCLAADNIILAPLPDLKPLIVSWISDTPDPFTGIALGALVKSGELEVLKGTPENWPPPQKPDVYVFEHWLPKEWPADRPTILLNPPATTTPLRTRALEGRGIPHDSIRLVAPDHPLAFRITTSRLALTQTCVIEAAGSLEPIWIAGNEPVLLAGELNGQRLVVSAVSPSTSEQLALLPAYPLMLGNAIYWCAEQSEAMSALKPLHPGDWLPATGLVKWTEWSAGKTTTASDQAANSTLEVNRLGIWETADGKTGSSILASTQETDVPKRTTTAAPTAQTKPQSTWATSTANWPRILIWLLLIFMLTESYLFHRRAVY